MTNREKFEEVFGIKAKTVLEDPCNIVDFDFGCKDKLCVECEISHFWDREYVEKDKEYSFLEHFLALLFVATNDVTSDMLKKELEKEERKWNSIKESQTYSKHTCGRCKFEYRPDYKFPCSCCIHNDDIRPDLWEEKEDE